MDGRTTSGLGNLHAAYPAGTAARLFKLKPRNEKQKENLIKHGNLAA